ncbi:hypothetical protein V2J09_003651 [Rumex salicifolius]
MSSCGGLMDFFPASFMLQLPNDNDHQTSQDFHGIAPMLGKRQMPYSGLDIFQEEANGNGSGEEDNLSDDGSQQLGEKKRRLNMEQVKTLEKSFEVGNKLEPERKVQLAKALGLQPRQVAIWFQNRRARWKTKQLEVDYVMLKRQFEALKAHNQSLLDQNHSLQSQISTFKGGEQTESINLNKETEQGSSSNKSESNSDIKLDNSTKSKLVTTETISRSFFRPPPPSSSYTTNRANGPTDRLFRNPGDLHCQKFVQTDREEGFNNMLSAIDDQSGLWHILQQHNYN